jgi:predicted ribosomally synthesized peptide with SipW-like signal peptide
MTSSGAPEKRKKSTIIRLAIAGVAVLGIGAAITTAAWTDQAWFTAQADAASIELYGALAVDGDCPAAPANPAVSTAPYVVADDLTGAVDITLASGTFALLVPGEERAAGICLWNGGDVALSTSLAPIVTAGDAVFAGTDPASIAVEDDGAAYATQTIAADAVLPLDVVVTTPGDWDNSYQGLTSGEIAITFEGTTDLP